MDTVTTLVLSADRWEDGPPAFWPIFPILWILIVGTLVFLAVRWARRNGRAAGPRAGERRLAERYADGEIPEEEYRSRLAVLRDAVNR